jgi:hypothetical protein
MADNGRPDRMRERQELQVATLKGDIRDRILRLVRQLPEHWQKMSGDAQQDVISNLERTAEDLVDQVVDLVSSRGADHQLVTLGKIAVDKGVIDCKFTAPYSNETMAALCSKRGQEVVLVARDADQFKGERAKAEPDNIGDLAIPRGSVEEVRRTMVRPPH